MCAYAGHINNVTDMNNISWSNLTKNVSFKLTCQFHFYKTSNGRKSIDFLARHNFQQATQIHIVMNPLSPIYYKHDLKHNKDLQSNH